jgi:hypothetical protein
MQREETTLFVSLTERASPEQKSSRTFKYDASLRMTCPARVAVTETHTGLSEGAETNEKVFTRASDGCATQTLCSRSVVTTALTCWRCVTSPNPALSEHH